MHKFTEPLRECMTICRNFILAFTFTLLSSVYVCAQVDTIHIGKIRSSVPIIGKLADLPYLFNGKGKWCYGTFNQEIKYYPCSIHDEQTIYVYHVNTIHDKRTRTSYCSDKEGNIRLWYLDFKLAKGSFIDLWGTSLFLTYETTLDDFIKTFNITDTIEYGAALMAPYNYMKKNGRYHSWRHRKYTSLWFLTDEGMRTDIIFSFDHKRRLRCVELRYFNAATVEKRKKPER